MSERTFTQFDAYNRNCQDDEIGKPWEPRWGVLDVHNGLCLPKQLGKPIPAADLADDGETPAYEPPLISSKLVQEARLRGIALNDAEALAYLALELDPEDFIQNNPTIYRDLMADQRRKRLEEAATVGKTKALTANQIAALHAQDLAGFVAAVLVEVLPLETFDERNSELMRLLKITPDMLVEAIDAD